MRFTIQGRSHHLTQEGVRDALAGRRPGPIQFHWVAVAGLHWPMKQALEVCTGIYRAEFTTNTARQILQRLGFQVSPQRAAGPRRRSPELTRRPDEFGADAELAWQYLAKVLLAPSAGRLIEDWERSLTGADTESLADLVARPQVAADLIEYATLARRHTDRLATLSAATAITLGLRGMLRDGERILEPPNLTGRSAPGFDLTTTLRRAQFVIGPLTAGNTVRQRRAVSSVVRLALDGSGTLRQLWTSDPLFPDFLRSCDLTIEWGLSRSPQALREAFEESHRSLRMPIQVFVHGPAADVELMDLNELVPEARLID